MLTKIANIAWEELAAKVYHTGLESSPRGQATLELLGKQTLVDMNYPVVVNASRKLGYKFMAAEAAWILSGDNRVSTIKKYSKEIERFSDDGLHFFGSYGTRFRDQVRHVLRALEIDSDSRQAVITLWRPNPPDTKDVPCTISLHWMIRDGVLHCFADMRSSDVWLGVPYDWFNFTMMTGYVALLVKERTGKQLGLGTLHFYAHSQHLYERNFAIVSKLRVEKQEVVFKPPHFNPFRHASADNMVEWLWYFAENPHLMKGEPE